METLEKILSSISNGQSSLRPVQQRGLAILKDYLKPNSEISLTAASASILDALQEQYDKDYFDYFFCEVCLDIAEELHYTHRSQLRLARLLQEVTVKAKALSPDPSILKKLGQGLRDALQAPERENPIAWVNFHSFAAKLEAFLWSSHIKPTWAIWAMRDAFEENDDYYETESVRDAYVLAAAQYVTFRGQDIIQRIACPGIVTDEDSRHWRPGPKYSRSASLDLARWHFWMQGFVDATKRSRARAEKDGLPGVADVATHAVHLMNSLQASMPGLGRSPYTSTISISSSP